MCCSTGSCCAPEHESSRLVARRYALGIRSKLSLGDQDALGSRPFIPARYKLPLVARLVGLSASRIATSVSHFLRSGSSSHFHATAHDTAHDTFMALPPYTF